MLNPVMLPSTGGRFPPLGLHGGDGGERRPDRIARIVYDAAGQVTQHLVGVGVMGSSQQGVAAATFGYTANGRLQQICGLVGTRYFGAWDDADPFEDFQDAETDNVNSAVVGLWSELFSF